MQVQRRLNRKHLDLIDSINWNRHTFCHASDLPSHIQINSQIVQIHNHCSPLFCCILKSLSRNKQLRKQKMVCNNQEIISITNDYVGPYNLQSGSIKSHVKDERPIDLWFNPRPRAALRYLLLSIQRVFVSATEYCKGLSSNPIISPLTCQQSPDTKTSLHCVRDI